ncbi:nebulin repeat domain-containing protein [Ditylenchus destructor]|nr:nebulin repeat domain-containing protein [Ditylenchus destructor]
MATHKCAREECGKTVYPMEELKCLDKVWHKGCFRCTSCGMALNMKNYKGYEKKPYCEPHYPKTVASVVVDTPEMNRLAQNTKLQSQVQYHAAYEKMKGTKIDVADDPELQRHRQNTKVQSQVQYHGEMEKKKTQEMNRPNEQLTSDLPSSTSTTFPTLEPYNNADDVHTHNGNGASSRVNDNNVVSYASYSTENNSNNYSSPYSERQANQIGTVVYSSEGIPAPSEQRQVGSIADYDPLNGQWGTSGASKTGEKIANVTAQKQSPDTQKQAGTKKTPSGKTSVGAASQPTSQPTAPTGKGAPGFAVKALYDYTAADKDEISFRENDVIVSCQKVDEGWMTGTVQRTMQWGMLPANYVEKINQPSGMFKLH